MASNLKNLSSFGIDNISIGDNSIIGIVVSEWNEEITGSLLNGALDTLKKYKVKKKNIIIKYVPGSFELPFGAKYLLSHKMPDAVICLGCVIQGETRHFEFICQAVSNGLMRLGLDYEIPVVFGVLTTDTLQQAKDRSGGKHGNKGVEAAVAALKLIAIKDSLR